MRLETLKNQTALTRVFGILLVAFCLSLIVFNVTGLACDTLADIDTTEAENTLWDVYKSYWLLPTAVALIGFFALPKTSKIREACLGFAIALVVGRIVAGNWSLVRGTFEAIVDGVKGASLITMQGTWI